jgi:DNA-binding CsgD family transcriptional regulator
MPAAAHRERPCATVAEAPFLAWFVPVESKLATPQPRPGEVERGSLLARVLGSPEPVVLVEAAAGYGRSTFLAQTLRADPRPSAWISLEARPASCSPCSPTRSRGSPSRPGCSSRSPCSGWPTSRERGRRSTKPKGCYALVRTSACSSGRIADLRATLALVPSERAAAASLTKAEVGILTLLPTHLTFPAMGEKLFLSRTTVKSQALSIHRKLGASSRAQGVDRARELGLLQD